MLKTHLPTNMGIARYSPHPCMVQNAKFGIFIHWGIYSVPMWSPKGTYEEWYKYWLDNKKLMGNGEFTGTEIYDYHTKMYGEDFNYADFAAKFKAHDYDAKRLGQTIRKIRCQVCSFNNQTP